MWSPAQVFFSGPPSVDPVTAGRKAGLLCQKSLRKPTKKKTVPGNGKLSTRLRILQVNHSGGCREDASVQSARVGRDRHRTPKTTYSVVVNGIDWNECIYVCCDLSHIENFQLPRRHMEFSPLFYQVWLGRPRSPLRGLPSGSILIKVGNPIANIYETNRERERKGHTNPPSTAPMIFLASQRQVQKYVPDAKNSAMPCSSLSSLEISEPRLYH